MGGVGRRGGATPSRLHAPPHPPDARLRLLRTLSDDSIPLRGRFPGTRLPLARATSRRTMNAPELDPDTLDRARRAPPPPGRAVAASACALRRFHPPPRTIPGNPIAPRACNLTPHDERPRARP